MKTLRGFPYFVLAAFLTFAVGACGTPADSATAGLSTTVAGLPTATPEEVGMSSERLSRLSGAMQQLVDEGRLAGITTMVARHGRIAHFETFGYRDIAADAPMTPDAIFRIYSMSKPITGVALMMLHEEGKFRLSDPVEMYIPEFEGLKVAVGEGQERPLVEEADHPMTVRELMSHTAGFGYGPYVTDSQVEDMYAARNVFAWDGTLRDMIERLADIPLRQQPGSMWYYSISVDVQGYLVEVLSGQPFDQFLEDRLFGPLGMVDTGFYVPPEKAGRFAELYGYDGDGRLLPPTATEFEEYTRLGSSVATAETVTARYLEPPTLLSGGMGMVSTTQDYMRFAQMLLNGGELDGIRILAPLTVDLMRRNQLPPEVAEMGPGPGPGLGFGLDFAVVTDPVEADGVSEGEYYWGGAAGTWFWIDPVEDLVFVGMIQQFGLDRPDVRSLSRRLTYQAIMEPGRSAH